MILVVMGVSGSGKTTVGRRLAERLGWRFIEADEYHPPANVEKMRAGIPLDDADRAPWLRTLAAVLDRTRAEGVPAVLACSALKRSYRDVLAGGHDDLVFLHLAAPYETILRRMAGRTGHYMPQDLLASQYAVLEPPAPDERAVTLDASEAAGRIVEDALRWLLESAGVEPAAGDTRVRDEEDAP